MARWPAAARAMAADELGAAIVCKLAVGSHPPTPSSATAAPPPTPAAHTPPQPRQPPFKSPMASVLFSRRAVSSFRGVAGSNPILRPSSAACSANVLCPATTPSSASSPRIFTNTTTTAKRLFSASTYKMSVIQIGSCVAAAPPRYCRRPANRPPAPTPTRPPSSSPRPSSSSSTSLPPGAVRAPPDSRACAPAADGPPHRTLQGHRAPG